MGPSVLVNLTTYTCVCLFNTKLSFVNILTIKRKSFKSYAVHKRTLKINTLTGFTEKPICKTLDAFRKQQMKETQKNRRLSKLATKI